MGQNEPISDFLNALRGSRTVIVGVGNTLKADDGFGPLICERLDGRISATVVDAGTVPENHIQRIVKAQPETLLIVDAIDFGARPGEVRIFKSEETGTFAFSTHALSLHLFVDVVRHRIEVDVYLLGGQPDRIELGRPLSEPVQKAVDSLAAMFQEAFPIIPDR